MFFPWFPVKAEPDLFELELLLEEDPVKLEPVLEELLLLVLEEPPFVREDPPLFELLEEDPVKLEPPLEELALVEEELFEEELELLEDELLCVWGVRPRN